MIWLILSIATSSLLYVIFKYFQVFQVNRLHAIVINYLVAFITGMIAQGEAPSATRILTADWLWYAITLGLLFITIFNVMALTSQKNGLSVAAVASKMSLVIPVIAGIWLYQESVGWLKILGIIIALASVYLSSIKPNTGIKIDRGVWILPIILFLGSGAIDTILKYAQEIHIADSDAPVFSATCFLVAFIAGSLVIVYELIRGAKFQWKSIVAGIALGIPNYFSIYFLIQALNIDMESSIVYPINHVGTVLVTALLGILLFKERMSTKNYLGVIMAVIAIICVAFAKA